MGSCTKDLILSHPGYDSSCAYVSDEANCGDQWDYLNFIGFYYCQLDQSVPLVILITALTVGVVFNFLGTTADTYLAPALEIITKKLKLSDAIAGVTLLALANGATDVIAGFVAGGKDSGGVVIAIGGLFGACLFTVTLVLARCIAGAGEIRVDAHGLKRDVLFLIFGTCYFLVLTFINEITWPLASGFFIIYFVFLGYVIYSEKAKQATQASYKSKLSRVKARLLKKPANDSLNEDKPDANFLWDHALNPYLIKNSLKRQRSSGLKPKLSVSLSKETVTEDQVVHKDIEQVKEDALHNEELEEEMTTFGRIMNVYNAPLLFIRNLTMPPFEEERWNVWFAAASPIFGILFFLWQTGLIQVFDQHWYLWIVYGVIVLSLSFFLFITGRNCNLAEEHSGKLATIAFIVSALWLNLTANCFMDLLSLITIISGLPLNFLSLTMLAWGNSLDDFFIDYVISKSGHGSMAVSGVYGGQLFNLLIGFGGAMVMQSTKSTVRPDIYDFNQGPDETRQNILTIVLVCCLIVELLLTLVVGKLRNWILGNKMKWFLIFFYSGFLIVVTIIALI